MVEEVEFGFIVIRDFGFVGGFRRHDDASSTRCLDKVWKEYKQCEGSVGDRSDCYVVVVASWWKDDPRTRWVVAFEDVGSGRQFYTVSRLSADTKDGRSTGSRRSVQKQP